MSGRRRQVSRTFNGRLSEAKKARAALIVEVSKGRHAGTKATLDELLDDWIVELKRKGRSPNTVHGYEKVHIRNIQPTLGAAGGPQGDDEDAHRSLRRPSEARLSPRSVYQIHACLSSMFTQACRWGWRESNPAQWAEPPSIPNTAPVVPSPDEVRALIDAAEQSRRPEYARAILVAATTGCGEPSC